VTRTTDAAATVMRLAVRLLHREAVVGGAWMRGERIVLCNGGSNRKQRQHSQAAGPGNSDQFFLPSLFIRENPSGRIVGTARLIVAFRGPRERYQEGDAKVVAVGFIFALETLGF